MADIAVAGLDRMGLPVRAALAEAGHAVAATDQRHEARADAAACGTWWQDPPDEAASGS